MQLAQKKSDNWIKEKLFDIFGKENVLISIEERYCYCLDCCYVENNKIELPAAVVFPRSTSELSKFMKFAFENEIKVFPRCSGTNHVGSCIPSKNSIVVSFLKMDKILDINSQNLTAKVQSGVVIEDFQKAVEKFNLFFPPDPANLKISTVGGAVSQSAGGPRGFKYGTTKDYVLSVEAVLANGDVIETSKPCHKNVAGYNLTQLLTGSEGTLALISNITFKLIAKPQEKNVVLAYFDSVSTAAACVCEIINHHISPSVIELMDQNTLKTIEMFIPSGLFTQFKACLLIEVDGFKQDVLEQSEIIKKICQEQGSQNCIVSKNAQETNRIWQARRSAFACCTKLDSHVMADDVVVPRENIASLVEGIESICQKYDIKVCIMGHIGDGNIHPNFALNLEDSQQRKRYLQAREEIWKLALNLNGSITAEHGIGFEKANFLQKNIPSVNLNLMKSIKKAFDPKNILNPGKIFERESL